MGYDKPDLGFVVHYQAPGSVISYYQQVGRAGRGVEHADVVLLRGTEDRRIQDFFIEQAFPKRELRRPGARGARRGGGGGPLAAVAHERRQPGARADRGDAQGARRRGRGHPRRQPLGARARRGLELRRRALCRRHRAAAARAGGDGGVRRRRAVPDARAAGGARRSRAARLRPLRGLRRRRASASRSTRSSCAPPRCTCAPSRCCSRSRRWRRPRTARCARSPRTCGPRRAARSHGSATAAGTRSCRRAGARAASTTSWSTPPPRRCARGARRSRGSTAVPSRRSGALVPDLAARLAAALGLPFAPVLERTGDGPPQREMANSAQQVANVRGQFAVAADAPARPVPARRRRALQRLDARDGRGPAAAAGCGGGVPARADDRVLSSARATRCSPGVREP